MNGVPRERAAILLGCLVPRNLVSRRQGIDQGMPADGGLLTLTGRVVVGIPKKLCRKGLPD